MVEWTVKELAERAGTSPRTLRHHHAIGLLVPDRVDDNGYRRYGPTAAARLQRILALREAGMPLAAIAQALADTPDGETGALEAHRQALEAERRSVEQRIATLEEALHRRRHALPPRADWALVGFNDQWADQVTTRWGRDAYEATNQWWHAHDIGEQRRFQAEAEELVAAGGTLCAEGHAPTDDRSQEQAARHVEWFTLIPGTPTHEGDARRSAAMVRGMADLYVEDPAYHEAFGGPQAASFAREALLVHVDRRWPPDGS